MTIRIIVFLSLFVLVSARSGIGGRIAVYPRTSRTNTLQKLIKNDWNCDPFTGCYTAGDYNYDCILEKCPYNKTLASDCPNKIVGQYSSMCLEIGNNDLKKKIFLGKSFSLVMEPNVVAKCVIYDVFSQFVSECELFRVNHADDSLTEMVNNKEYPNHHRIYYRTTKSLLEAEKQQFALMKDQMDFNKQSVEIVENDYTRKDFAIVTPIMVHPFKVTTASGVSFTLPEGYIEKYALPVYAELNMGLSLVGEDCFYAYETESRVLIKKTFVCLVKEFFSF
jgi:hypothetical protein